MDTLSTVPILSKERTALLSSFILILQNSDAIQFWIPPESSGSLEAKKTMGAKHWAQNPTARSCQKSRKHGTFWPGEGGAALSGSLKSSCFLPINKEIKALLQAKILILPNRDSTRTNEIRKKDSEGKEDCKKKKKEKWPFLEVTLKSKSYSKFLKEISLQNVSL